MKKQKSKPKVKSKKDDYDWDDPLSGDMSDYIAKADWKKMSDFFVYMPKDTTVTFRVPEDMLNALKSIANKEKTDYQKLIREALIEFIAKRVS